MKLEIKHVPLTLLVLYSLKGLILGVNWELTPILLILGLISIYYEYKLNNKQLEEINKSLKENKELLEFRSREFDEIKGSLSTIKLASGFRTQSTK